MSALDLALAHAVKLALGVLLVGMLWRGRVRECRAFALYVVAVLLGNSLVSFWPRSFLTPWFWISKQAVYDLLKLGIGLELLYHTLRAFPGTWRAARLTVVLLLGGSTIVLVESMPHASFRTFWDWQPLIATSTVWLLTAIALLVVWYRVPITAWARAILLGFAPYLLVFLTVVDLLRRHGWDARARLEIVDSLAYLVLVLFWARAAWERESGAAALDSADRPALAVLRVTTREELV